MSKYYIGDTGLEIILDCKCDVSAAINTQMFVQKPNGTLATWAANKHTIDGLTNYLRYYTAPTDLDVPGKYHIQASLTDGVWTGRGETAHFTVLAPFC